MALSARGGYALLSRLLQGSSLATLGAVALAVAVYAAAAVLFGAVKREDLLALPKGEKLAKILPMK
jgi:stage V sporulation protein B